MKREGRHITKLGAWEIHHNPQVIRPPSHQNLLHNVNGIRRGHTTDHPEGGSHNLIPLAMRPLALFC